MLCAVRCHDTVCACFLGDGLRGLVAAGIGASLGARKQVPSPGPAWVQRSKGACRWLKPSDKLDVLGHMQLLTLITRQALAKYKSLVEGCLGVIGCLVMALVVTCKRSSMLTMACHHMHATSQQGSIY